MSKIFVFLGKAAAGKSELSKDIARDLNFNEIVSCTSRPPRPGEVNGKDYHFIGYDDFKPEDFVEINEFRGWRYGVKKDSIEEGKTYVVVLEPKGYRKFKETFGDKVVGIYIMAPRENRWVRYISRDGNYDEAFRRFIADDEDFSEFHYEAEYTIVNNKEYKDLVCKAIDIVSWELL